MGLLFHIVRKDLRQAWPYGAAAIAVLILNTANFARVLATRGSEQGAALGVQIPLDWLLAISWALYYGIVLLGDTVPGTRQHWISRPIRWQSLLAAKLLLLPIFAIPVAVAHLIQLALRGFSLAEHGGPVAWNAFWLVFVGLLPVAAVASLCRNLQQLALWILALAAGVLALQQWDAPLPNELQGVVNDVTVGALVLSCAVILIWQYSTRRSGLARIATIAFVAILSTLDHWPAAVWRALSRSRNVPTTLALTPPFEWDDTNLRIPVRLDQLPPKHLLKSTDWLVRAATSTSSTTDIRTSDSIGSAGSSELWMSTLSGFFTERSTEEMNIEITGEFTLYSEPGHAAVPLDGSRFLPGIGLCQSWFDKLYVIDCQSVLGSAKRIDVFPAWWIGSGPNGKVTPLATSNERAPLGLVPQPHPIALLSGDLFPEWNGQRAEILLLTRAPIANIQRSFQLRSLRLVELLPAPKPPPPGPKPVARSGDIPDRPAPTDNSPAARDLLRYWPNDPMLDTPYKPRKAPK